LINFLGFGFITINGVDVDIDYIVDYNFVVGLLSVVDMDKEELVALDKLELLDIQLVVDYVV
jgi:hypothetical protein